MNTQTSSDKCSDKPATDADIPAILARLTRLERLEEQSFFQEQTIAALNDALTGQQHQLDLLETRMIRVEEKLLALWEQIGDEGGESTAPPHYQYR